MQACHDFSSNEKTKAKTDENVNHDCKGLRSLGIKHVRISRITEFLKLEYCQLSPNEKCQPHQTDHLVFTLGPPSKLLIKFVCLGWKQWGLAPVSFLACEAPKALQAPRKNNKNEIQWHCLYISRNSWARIRNLSLSKFIVWILDQDFWTLYK